MKKVIVVAQMPSDQNQWLMFLAASGTVTAKGGPPHHVEELAQNVWQIDFEASPTTFAKLVNAMKQLGIPGRMLPLDADSQWLQVDSNRTPT